MQKQVEVSQNGFFLHQDSLSNQWKIPTFLLFLLVFFNLNLDQIKKSVIFCKGIWEIRQKKIHVDSTLLSLCSQWSVIASASLFAWAQMFAYLLCCPNELVHASWFSVEPHLSFAIIRSMSIHLPIIAANSHSEQHRKRSLDFIINQNIKSMVKKAKEIFQFDLERHSKRIRCDRIDIGYSKLWRYHVIQYFLNVINESNEVRFFFKSRFLILFMFYFHFVEVHSVNARRHSPLCLCGDKNRSMFCLFFFSSHLIHLVQCSASVWQERWNATIHAKYQDKLQNKDSKRTKGGGGQNEQNHSLISLK